MRPFTLSSCHLITLSLLALTAAPSRADSFVHDRFPYTDVTINGLRNGRLSATLKGTEHEYDLDGILNISLTAFPKLAEAEAARANPDQAKQAAALYKQIIPTINRLELKRLVEWR